MVCTCAYCTHTHTHIRTYTCTYAISECGIILMAANCCILCVVLHRLVSHVHTSPCLPYPALPCLTRSRCLALYAIRTEISLIVTHRVCLIISISFQRLIRICFKLSLSPLSHSLSKQLTFVAPWVEHYFINMNNFVNFFFLLILEGITLYWRLNV